MVAVPTFLRLNDGWNADPNVPEPMVRIQGQRVDLSFRLDLRKPRVVLRFDDYRQWRLGATNDEGWYMGQCRYSRFAPAWGEFYELLGDDGLLPKPRDWQPLPGAGDRHFLFYLRGRDLRMSCRRLGVCAHGCDIADAQRPAEPAHRDAQRHPSPGLTGHRVPNFSSRGPRTAPWKDSARRRRG